MEKITLNVKNPRLLAEWLHKFTSVTSDIILEVDMVNNKLMTKTYSLGSDVVKIGEKDFSELLIDVTKKSNETIVDVGILGLPTFVKKLMLSKDIESVITIVYDFQKVKDYYIKSNKVIDVYYGNEINISNKDYKLRTKCGVPAMFKKMPSEILENVTYMCNDWSFELDSSQISKISSLSALEAQHDKKIRFYIEDDSLKVGNSNFEYILCSYDTQVDFNSEIYIDLTMIQKLDAEKYRCSFNEAKLKLESTETNTCIVICALSINR